MTFFNQVGFKTPVLRVNDKDANIVFYQECLGLRLVSEENALAFFCLWDNTETVFMIEESPSYRTRAVQGLKKLHRLVFKTSNPEDIEQLLARDIPVTRVLRGNNGYAFEVLSPENDLILLHAEEDIASLKEVERPNCQSQSSFKGLSDATVTELTLNVPDMSLAQSFYQELFQGRTPLQLHFLETEGQDLQTPSNEVWDLEILSFQVDQEADLASLRTALENKGHQVYLDSKSKLLVVSDTSNIEVWIEK